MSTERITNIVATILVIIIIAAAGYAGYVLFNRGDSSDDNDNNPNQAVTDTNENQDQSQQDDQSDETEEDTVSPSPGGTQSPDGETFENVLANDYEVDVQMFTPDNETLLEPAQEASGEVYGYSFDAKQLGSVYTINNNNEFQMVATFELLPELDEDYFYEGWLVRSEPFDFVSTGPVVDYRGRDINVFTSGIDYSDYDQYVLTIEPNDDNPAPDIHILEGTIE